MENTILINLTNLTNNLELLGLETKPEIATPILFPDIQKLLELSFEMRHQHLCEWKYYSAFLETIYEHRCEKIQKQYIQSLTWNESFTMCLILHIFH